MKNRNVLLALLLSLCLCLTACGDDDTPSSQPQSGGPGRMIRSIEVSVQPEDPDFDRTYITQENMNELLSLLRSMADGEEPETEPDVNAAQSIYSATVTNSGGDQTVYCLLDQSYMRLDDEPWCLVDQETSLQFTDFIRTHPSDDGSAPVETTAPPAETTAPAETSAPTE